MTLVSAVSLPKALAPTVNSYPGRVTTAHMAAAVAKEASDVAAGHGASRRAARWEGSRKGNRISRPVAS